MMKCLLPLILLSTACGSKRDQAAMRGLRFLEQVAENPEHFKAHGDDLLWAFYTLSEAALDRDLKRESLAIGRRNAARWREAHPKLPPDAGVNRIYSYASASSSADDLGIRDEAMRQDIERAARRFGAVDFLSFDPAAEGPPADLPQPCERCNARNRRGVAACKRCGARLAMQNPYDILFDALITAYTGRRYGVRLGADLADVTRWIPAMRPYPALPNDAVTYAITHIVYVLNDYGRYKLNPEWLPREFAYLKANAQKSIDASDPESLGEFIDSLQAFGVPDGDPLIRRGVEYLLARQNADGSWGSASEKDIYTRYHTTWTGMAA